VISILSEELQKEPLVTAIIHLQTALERCVSLLCVPPTRCNSVDWNLPEEELKELLVQGAHEYFQRENPLPKALYASFDAIVQRPPFLMLLRPQTLTHRDIIVAMAAQCSKIGAITGFLTEDDAQLVASKAPRLSKLLLAQYAVVKTSENERESFTEHSQELVFSGATS